MITSTQTNTYDRRRAAVLTDELRDFVTGCSPGCTLTAHEVEDNLRVDYPTLVRGSLRFSQSISENESDAAVFEARFLGGTITGIVKFRALVENNNVVAYSDIRVLQVEQAGKPEAVKVASRYLGRTGCTDQSDRTQRLQKLMAMPRGTVLHAGRVEKDLSWRYDLLPGSLRFEDLAPGQAITRFTARLRDGSPLTGTVHFVSDVGATRDVLTVWGDVRVDNDGVHSGTRAG